MAPRIAAAALVPSVLLLACGGPERAVKKLEPPDPPLTGRQAFQRMFPAARSWAIDSLPLQLQSYNLRSMTTANGKSGAWTAIFVSPSLHKSRAYNWSAIEAEGNLHKGVFADLEREWSGPSSQTMPFAIAAIRVDSDAALQTALRKVKAPPDVPMLFILERTPRFPDLAWRVIWGQSVSASDVTVFVDATTGKFLETIR